jgi:hypothetical protein
MGRVHHLTLQTGAFGGFREADERLFQAGQGRRDRALFARLSELDRISAQRLRLDIEKGALRTFPTRLTRQRGIGGDRERPFRG